MITKLGKQQLEQQIQYLEEELKRTFQERSEAAAEGDLKENSAYIFMGERANVLKSQIDEAKNDLKDCVVQIPPTHCDFVCFGHQVSVLFIQDKRSLTLVLVGKNDARLKPNWISIHSPLGQAILGKKKLDQVLVNDQLVTITDIAIGEI